jgi:hypothetical protein
MSARWRKAASVVWIVLLAASIAACAAGFWRAWHDVYKVQYPLAAVGIAQTEEDDDSVTDPLLVSGIREAVAKAIPSPAHVTGVGGRVLASGADIDAVAAALTGPPGKVAVTLRDQKGTVSTVVLGRGPDVALAVSGFPPALALSAECGGKLIAVVAFLACGVLLFYRRREETLALLVSFALLIGAPALIAESLWVWLNVPAVDAILSNLFILLMIVTIPAFPSGEFGSRIASWFTLVASAIVVGVLLMPVDVEIQEMIAYLLLPVAAVIPLRRFRRTEPGVERQQLKWAGVGVASCAPAAFIGVLVAVVPYIFDFPQPVVTKFAAVGGAIVDLSFVPLALGLTVSLMRFRLWSADKAIGRSVAASILTLGLGGVWASSTLVSNRLLHGLFGDNQAAVAAASAIVAAAILSPARTRVNAWVEKRFHAGRLALHGLPDQIRAWRLSDTPGEVGRRVLATIVDHLHADGAALAIFEDGAYRTVVAQGVEAARVDDWLAQLVHPAGSVAVDDPLFPYRFPLLDTGDPVGFLLVTRRHGVEPFMAEELASMQALAAPLAAALRLAHRQQVRERRNDEAVAALERRLALLEGERVSPGYA